MAKQNISSEQKHKFEEERVRRLLIYAFPETYQTAKLSESPDIIVPEKSIGVEVTDSTIQVVHQNLSYVSDISSGKISLHDHVHKKKGNQNIAICTLPNKRNLAAFAMWGDTHDLLSAYQKKTKKLNQPHYTVFDENNLFITAWEPEEDALEGLVDIRDDTGDAARKFRFVYVFAKETLLTLDLKKQEITKMPIPNEVVKEISEQAFIRIMGMRRDAYYGSL